MDELKTKHTPKHTLSPTGVTLSRHIFYKTWIKDNETYLTNLNELVETCFELAHCLKPSRNTDVRVALSDDEDDCDFSMKLFDIPRYGTLVRQVCKPYDIFTGQRIVQYDTYEGTRVNWLKLQSLTCWKSTLC